MIRLLTIFLVVMTLFSCDQLLNRLSENSKEKTEKSDAKRDGKVIKKYSNGKVRAEIIYKDGKKHGLAKEYYENGQLKLSVTYENGLKNGPSQYYYKDGKIYQETNYKNGKIDGFRKKYSGGKLVAEVPFKDGVEAAGLKEYYLSGKEKSFPSLQIKTKDTRPINNKFTIELKFSESNPEDIFFIGELKEGKYMHFDMEQVMTENGIGTIEIDVPPGAFLMQEVNFVGIHRTNIGNKYITEKKFNLVIE